MAPWQEAQGRKEEGGSVAAAAAAEATASAATTAAATTAAATTAAATSATAARAGISAFDLEGTKEETADRRLGVLQHAKSLQALYEAAVERMGFKTLNPKP